MKSKHTKGPWIVETIIESVIEHHVVITLDGTKHIATATNSRRVGKFPWDTAKKAKANAHLIAAAPDLLEALEELIQCIATDTKAGCIQRSMAMNEDLKTAFLAIIKAKGE